MIYKFQEILTGFHDELAVGQVVKLVFLSIKLADVHPEENASFVPARRSAERRDDATDE